MKVEIVSRETIKPSSPTPPHLRTFKLSLLDRLNPPHYGTHVFFYHPISKQGRIQTNNRSDQLKKSLSETLSRYYPLAGRFKVGFSNIDCNDEGADYIEAHVNCELSKFLEKPEIEVLNRFLPYDSVNSTEPVHGIVQLAIQVNNFDCGGLAIGMCFLHMIIDGSSFAAVVKDWASISRGSTEAVSPIFLQDSFYPLRDLDSSSGLLPNENIEPSEAELITTTRKGRFVFTASSIAALKAKVSDKMPQSTVKLPSRVEVVLSLICQRIMAACRAKPAGSKRHPFVARHILNMRAKLVPPLPGNTIGNMIWETTVSSTNERESELVDLVLQLREATAKIDNEYLRKFQGEEGSWRLLEDVEETIENYSKEEVDSCLFTSGCRLPFYEADFGWGKPWWVSYVNIEATGGVNNIVILMDTNQGDGIEAWMMLDEQIMAVLERDKNFLAFALSNPSVHGVNFNRSSL